jgi:intracellular septation protein A
MASEELFTRDEALSGLPAQRARTLLFLIESQTAHLAAQDRRVMERFLTEEAARERDLAFLEAFALGRDPPLRPTIQDLERHSGQWAGLVPENPRLRAALAGLLGQKYALSQAAVPGIRAAVGLDTAAVQQAYQRLHNQPLGTIYTARPGLQERLRWAGSALSRWLESFPPFWSAFSLTLTETVGASILALPIALAEVGPLAGLFLLVVLGIVNILTIMYVAETLTRSGSVRFGSAYFGRLVSDYLGNPGSILFSLSLALLNFLVLIAYYIGIASTMESATRLPAAVWVALVFIVGLYFVRRESINATVTTALVVGAVNIALILALSLLAFPHVKVENLAYVNLPFLDGRPFEPSILKLVFGIILSAYFGHTSIANGAGRPEA